MMKKNDLSTTFILGVGLIVFVAATAISFALDECNKMVRSEKEMAGVACFLGHIEGTCTGNEECIGSQGVKISSSDFTEYYFSRKTGNNSDHAIAAGTILCGYVYNCTLDKDGFCIPAYQATDPKTDEPIERHITYYDNASCTISG